MHTCVCILTAEYTVKPVLSGHSKNEDQLSLNAGQKYCRMLPLEHSAIHLTIIKLPIVIKIFVLSFLSGFLRHASLLLTVTYMYFLFCGVRY